MEFVEIDKNLIPASRIGLGTWAIGGWLWGGTDEDDSIAAILSALERGINIIDTAPVYGLGLSEEIIRKALAEYNNRKEVILATKVGLEWQGNNIFRNSSRKRILEEIDNSLRRLNTDYIDIYQVHWPDNTVLIEETAEAMNDLYREGKILAIGVSNYNTKEMEAFRNVAPLHVLQPPFNMFEQDIKYNILPYCKIKGIKTLAYGSLCRGLLSGRMKLDTQFKGDDIRKSDPKFQMPRYIEYLKAVKLLDDFAFNNFGLTVLHLALRWMLDYDGVDIALWGVRNPGQLSALDEIWSFSLDSRAYEEIAKIISDTITDPLGPEFMAPPKRISIKN